MNNQYTYLVAYTITPKKTPIGNYTVSLPLDTTRTRENKISSHGIEEIRKELETGHSEQLGYDVTVSFQNFMLL